jgi:hypothetical protein
MGLRPTKMMKNEGGVILSAAKDLLFSWILSNIRDANHVFRRSEARDLLFSWSHDVVEGTRESRSLGFASG